jgi:DNA invertase Pin-like site-specific DNA recombinase
MLISYARVSTNAQDLMAQRNALRFLGVDEDNIHVDHGLTGTNRERPGLREALAAVRSGDTLVVAKLDRLARSLPDARDIADELTRKGVALSLGGSVYDPSDPVGRLLFNVLGMVAESESDLIRMRTREGMAVAKAKGRLRGKKPNLSAAQARHLVNLHRQELTLHPRSRSCSASHAPLSTAPSNEPLGPKQLRSNLTAGRCVHRLRPPSFEYEWRRNTFEPPSLRTAPWRPVAVESRSRRQGARRFAL